MMNPMKFDIADAIKMYLNGPITSLQLKSLLALHMIDKQKDQSLIDLNQSSSAHTHEMHGINNYNLPVIAAAEYFAIDFWNAGLCLIGWWDYIETACTR